MPSDSHLYSPTPLHPNKLTSPESGYCKSVPKMDTDLNTGDLSELNKRQRQLFLEAQSRKGECPRDRPSKDDFYLSFMKRIEATGALPQPPTDFKVPVAVMPFGYPPCISPMSSLENINIKDLRLETHHRGRRLLIRTITPSIRTMGVMSVVEDEEGEATTLYLYQQDSETVRKATQVVSVGTIFQVKEPYFTIMENREYGIRVDHVSDIVEVDETAAIVPWKWRLLGSAEFVSADALKEEGNAAIRRGDPWIAIKK